MTVLHLYPTLEEYQICSILLTTYATRKYGYEIVAPHFVILKNHLNQGRFNLNNALGIPNGSALLLWGLGGMEYLPV